MPIPALVQKLNLNIFSKFKKNKRLIINPRIPPATLNIVPSLLGMSIHRELLLCG